MKYKNISYSAKTFYGVRFEPGEVKEVPGYINSSCMVRVAGHKPTTIKSTDGGNSGTTHRRGRKKSNESEKVIVVDTEEKILEENLNEEETIDGNPS